MFSIKMVETKNGNKYPQVRFVWIPLHRQRQTSDQSSYSMLSTKIWKRHFPILSIDSNKKYCEKDQGNKWQFDKVDSFVKKSFKDSTKT